MRNIITKVHEAYNVISAITKAYSIDAITSAFLLETLTSIANDENEKGENFIAQIYQEAITNLEEARWAMELEREK